MKIAKINAIALILCSVFFTNGYSKVEAIIGPTTLTENPNYLGFLPETDNNEVIISKSQFIVSYNRTRRSPNWVSWTLSKDNLGSASRSNQFASDIELETYFSQNQLTDQIVRPSEYSKTCYDRGHQTPSADRTNTAENNEATFLMSNMIPQTPYLNRNIWVSLETYARNLVKNQNKKLFIFAGPIYDQDFGSIGPKKDIPVPSKNFKIIFVLDSNQSVEDINETTANITVIMPNTLIDGSIGGANTDGTCKKATTVSTTTTTNQTEEFNLASDSTVKGWQQFQSTLSNVELKSGLKFIQKIKSSKPIQE
jgi:endonuclease G